MYIPKLPFPITECFYSNSKSIILKTLSPHNLINSTSLSRHTLTGTSRVRVSSKIWDKEKKIIEIAPPVAAANVCIKCGVIKWEKSEETTNETVTLCANFAWRCKEVRSLHLATIPRTSVVVSSYAALQWYINATLALLCRCIRNVLFVICIKQNICTSRFIAFFTAFYLRLFCGAAALVMQKIPLGAYIHICIKRRASLELRCCRFFRYFVTCCQRKHYYNAAPNV